jgi:2-hydroxychromene-2-carboxylate isomerase
VLKGAALRSVAASLEAASEEAAQAGVRAVPAVLAAGRVFHGERALAEAAARLRAARPQDGGSPLTIHRSG